MGNFNWILEEKCSV